MFSVSCKNFSHDTGCIWPVCDRAHDVCYPVILPHFSRLSRASPLAPSSASSFKKVHAGSVHPSWFLSTGLQAHFCLPTFCLVLSQQSIETSLAFAVSSQEQRNAFPCCWLFLRSRQLRETKATGAGDDNTAQKKPEIFGHCPEWVYVCANDRKFPSSAKNDAKSNYSQSCISRDLSEWQGCWQFGGLHLWEQGTEIQKQGKTRTFLILQCCQLRTGKINTSLPCTASHSVRAVFLLSRSVPKVSLWHSLASEKKKLSPSFSRGYAWVYLIPFSVEESFCRHYREIPQQRGWKQTSM